MSYVHAAVSMNPSAGVIRQMAEEQRAAIALGLDWKVWLCQPVDRRPRFAKWPALRYALLRVRFYLRLTRLARQGHRIVLRYSPGDPFLFLASFFLGTYFTVHHTQEEGELAASKFSFARLQLVFERVLGRRVIARAVGLVCVTQEIAQYELGRIPALPGRSVLIYPNGVLYPDDDDGPADRREDKPELAFVASTFFYWHGLDELLDSMGACEDDALLHLVGTLPERARRKAAADTRVRIHGRLDRSRLDALVARCWLGLSSFGLSSIGMKEACTLKVRDYLRAGMPVYAGHRDSALPTDFAYFRQGPTQWRTILEYARAMRVVPRATVAIAARPLIDKKVLLERLHRSLNASVF